MISKKIIVGVSLVFASTAFGAKAHRTAKKELKPKLKETAAAIKTSCGAKVKVGVDWKSFNKTKTDKISDAKNNIGYELKYIAEHSKKFCSDDESKALFKKNVKSIMVGVDQKNGDPETTYRKGKFKINTTFQSNSGGYKYQSTLEEW